jgi:hypothetical protein
MRRLIILVVAGLTVSAVLAEDAPRYIGFIDGHDWLPDGEDEKLAYTTGVIDGLVFAPIFESDAQMIENFVDCVDGMSSEQIKAIVQKYLDDNPGKWHQAMNRSVFVSIADTCASEQAGD